MKIAIISPACHFTNTGAAQKDIYSSLFLLKKMGHEVVMYTLDSPAQNHELLMDVSQKYGVPVKKFLPKNKLITRVKYLFYSSFSLFDGGVNAYQEMAEDANFVNFVDSWKPEAIFCFCSYSWPILKYAYDKRIKAVFRSHNFEPFFHWESLSTKEKFNPLNIIRVFAKYNSEKLAAKYAGTIGTLPFEQSKLYTRWNKNTQILPLLFLPESLRQPNIHKGKASVDLFYLGASYNIIFHLRGAEMLIKEIVPRVNKLAPGKFVFHVCGSKLPKYLVESCRDNIIYEGYVPDLDAFLSKMDAGVFPVMTGKNMKGKIFESFVRAFPIVMPDSCNFTGGEPLTDGVNILLANSVEEFVEKVVLLSDENLRVRIASGAAGFAKKEFGEEKIMEILEKLFK